MKPFQDVLFSDASELIAKEGFSCSCGKHHSARPLEVLKIENGALFACTEALRQLNVRKPFIVMGENGYQVAGKQVLSLLAAEHFPYRELVIPAEPRILPNEAYTERIEQAYDPSCDFILGIGSGVINDLCKLLAHHSTFYGRVCLQFLRHGARRSQNHGVHRLPVPDPVRHRDPAPRPV